MLGAMNSMDVEVIRTAMDWMNRGHRVVRGTVVRTWGSSPRPPGSLMIIRDDGQVAGNVLILRLAGEDTTANTLAWMIWLLWRNPDARARVLTPPAPGTPLA